MTETTTTKTEPTPKDIGDVGLHRMSAKDAGACIGCPTEAFDEAVKAKASFLAIEYEEQYISLCPLHEMATLQLLLNNYVRRRKRGKRVPAHLAKAESSEDNYMEVSWEKQGGIWTPREVDIYD